MSGRSKRRRPLGGSLLFLSSHLLAFLSPDRAASLSPPAPSPIESPPSVNRRDAFRIAGGSFAAVAAAASASVDGAFALDPSASSRAIGPDITDPPPRLSVPAGPKGQSTLKIPRVGYSLYKTPPDQAGRCVSLALRAGVEHYDVATSYTSNDQVAVPLKKYLDVGTTGLDYSAESTELLERLDGARVASDERASRSGAFGLRSSVAPPPVGSAGRRGRREGLFLAHKLSNDEQSTSPVAVRRAVKSAIATLGCTYLDMISIHSPLTDPDRRLNTYRTLLDLRDAGFVKSVGVCNYGLGPLRELERENLELPSVNQLELSPFNPHDDVVNWCRGHDVAVCCAAWSKLSGIDGPAEQWAVLADIAKRRAVTKAQVLVRWSLQKGYVCVPRSGCGSKLERLAIGENSYGGVDPPRSDNGGSAFVLTEEEMNVLDSLDVGLKAGKLGRRDGWSDDDVLGPEWDPTDVV